MIPRSRCALAWHKRTGLEQGQNTVRKIIPLWLVNRGKVSDLITFAMAMSSEMRTQLPPSRADGQGQPLKLLLWLALIFGALGYLQAGEIVEDTLRVARNRLHPTPASGQIAFVAIDDRSTAEVGAWPWPREKLARLIDQARSKGAGKIFLQVPLEDPSNPAADQALAGALERAGSVTLPVRTRQGNGHDGEQARRGPLPMFADHARLADKAMFYNYQQAVWQAPFASSFGDLPVAGMAAAISGREELPTAGSFRIDYSIDPAGIPRFAASDLLAGRVSAKELRGRTLVIDFDNMSTGDQLWVPGQGRMATAYASMLGAETLKLGTPRDLGFVPPFLVALLLGALSLRTSGRRGEVWPIVAGFLFLLILPVALEANLVFVDVFAGLGVLSTLAVRLAYRRWRSGGLVNADTGLLNLTALREARLAPDQLLVAARIHNYAEIVSTLSDKSQAELVRQIVQRLAVADSPLTVYQGDEGIFAWFTDSDAALPDHLEALHSFFRAPVSMGPRAIDVALTFGVEMGSRRSNASRLGSALVAADEAWGEGLRWKYHDPSREEEVSWRLSLLGELDAAIDKGQVWVAFQPQFDLRSNRVIGAEALARWTHPQKGPISPAEFVAAAEQQGRIAKLTDFVLDRAVSTAAAINRRGTPFTIAVNISPRLLNDPDLVSRIRQSVKKHGLPAERLTLELTETEALQGADGGLSILESLRALGVRIAIDDYGTGLSTLEYLRKIPASEIKVDQSFIKAMKVNRSDLIMVQSTIALAHSLGRTVVAEGVEDRATLQQLEQMGCDVVQGYVIGRPMGLRELVQGMQGHSTRHVA